MCIARHELMKKRMNQESTDSAFEENIRLIFF